MVALAVGTTVGALAMGPEQEFAGFAAFITAFSLGVYGRVWEIGVGAVVGLAGIAALNLLDPQPGRSLANSLLFIGLFVYGGPMLIGRIVRARSQLVGRLREQSEQLRVEREVTAAMAAAADRVEIVRELHRTVSGCVRELLTGGERRGGRGRQQGIASRWSHRGDRASGARGDETAAGAALSNVRCANPRARASSHTPTCTHASTVPA